MFVAIFVFISNAHQRHLLFSAIIYLHHIFSKWDNTNLPLSCLISYGLGVTVYVCNEWVGAKYLTIMCIVGFKQHRKKGAVL